MKLFLTITYIVLSGLVWAISPNQVHALTNSGAIDAVNQVTHPSVVMVLAYFQNGTHGQSTGFFINPCGDIATTHHSVFNATQIKISTSDKKNFRVRKIKRIDKQGDVAILSVDIPLEMVYPVIFSERIPAKGDAVHIIGHPLGHKQNIAVGLISSLYEVINFDKLIQFTAPIEIGSSGSPLFNKNGKVIGIASFMLFTGNKSSPFNFAIPSYRIAAP